MSNWIWTLFVLGTVLCWGAYGPTLQKGQAALGSNAWKAILCVGAAYFVLAVVIPVIILKVQQTPMNFPADGTFFASLAGALGAIGAMCIAGAFKTGGSHLIVMPLVFGCAPLMNIIVSSALHPPEKAPSPYLYVGVVLLAAGAGMVLYFKP